MRTTNIIKLSTLVLGTIVVGCSSGTSTGPGGSVGGNASTSTTSTGGHNGTSTTATGGNPAAGGTSAGSVGGTSATTGTHTAATGGTNTTAAGGTKSVGGATAAGGTKSVGGATAAGGTTAATGGTSAGNVGGATGAGGTSTAAVGGANPAGGDSAVTTGGSTSSSGANVISNFEDTPGKATIVPNPPVSTMTGYWYTFADTSCTGTQTPVAVSGAAVDSTQLASADQTATNKYAMHSVVTSCGSDKYSGFGVGLRPDPSDSTNNKRLPVDLSAYDGISFRIKGTSSSQIYVEFQTTDCVAAAGGGTATSSNSDAYNCHGYLIKTVPTTWTQMYVPFRTTGIRWFPTGSTSVTPHCTTSEFCEAPVLDLTKVTSIQFGLEGPFNLKPTPVTSYDVWIDDLGVYKLTDPPADSGLDKSYTMSGSFPFPANKAFTGCSMPKDPNGKAPDGKFMLDAYALWKSKFVTGTGSSTKVVSPEIDNGATVSEGIGYGMLLAVYFGDKTLFDGLLGYLKSNGISGANLLMNWKQPGGSGSASDADEDAAFALQMARKQWGTAYDADAAAVLSQFLAKDVDSSGNLTPGSDFTANGASALWNPSYFAPAYYKYFATVDTANASKWNGLVSKGYAYLNSISGTNGLVPAWCTSSCASRGGGGYTDADKYQYDSHRMPFRTGLDACWNGSQDAKTYLDKVVGFFAGKAGANKAAGGGLGILGDIYDSSGAVTSNSATNSMSLIGCSGVGAMGSSVANAATYRDRVWSFLLEGQYTKDYMYTNGDTSTKPGYTYYNATVGLMTALAMSGNFYIMQ